MFFKTKLSNKNQIFIASLVLISIPFICTIMYFSNKSISNIKDQYNQSISEITNQININIDALLENANRLGAIHIINDDVYKALTTNYDNKEFRFAKTSQMMKINIANAINLNPNIINVVFINQHGNVYDYNFSTNKELQSVLDQIDSWAEAARNNENYTYVGPLQYSKYSSSIYKNIIPMVKILKDINLNQEIGIMYLGINFDSISKFFLNSKLPDSNLAFFDQDNEYFFSTDKDFPENFLSDKYLTGMVNITDSDTPDISKTLTFNGKNYIVDCVYNNTTKWKIAHIVDNEIVSSTFKRTNQNLFTVFILTAVFDLILAYILSLILSNSIRKLCNQIDSFEIGSDKYIHINTKFVSKELQQLVNSYNKLNTRLVDSINQNYTIKLNEKQLKLQMLRSQINPHFLYNTLNSISSLANIHNIPEIKIIATSMSDLLRYNLKGNSVVKLKEELEQVQRYIAIQQIRFPNKFEFEYSISQNILEMYTPIFILQPIIENAILHGLDEIHTGGYISLTAYTDANIIHILVCDKGKGIEEHKLEELRSQLNKGSFILDNKAIGIFNVNQRIKSYYGNDFGLSIESAVNEGTIIDISLPNKKLE